MAAERRHVAAAVGYVLDVRVKHDLSAGDWAVLALLCEAPRHGYAVATVMAPDGEIGRVWSLRRSMTYRTIATLEGLGLLTVDTLQAGARAPERRVMRGTPEAQERVAAWLRRPVEHVRDLRVLLLLKLCFLRRRGEPVTGLLRVQRAVLARQEQALAAQRDGGDELARTLARWRWSMTTAALHFVDLMLAEAGVPGEASRPDGAPCEKRLTARAPGTHTRH
jgi:PadR family transcriptional regulator AphA